MYRQDRSYTELCKIYSARKPKCAFPAPLVVSAIVTVKLDMNFTSLAASVARAPGLSAYGI